MQSFSIGRYALSNPVLLAPMSGVTDAAFRRMAAALGAGLVVSEMTACAALAGSGRPAQTRMARRRMADHGAGLHVVQLAGCEARWMEEGARIAEDAGAEVIDINMGCPAKHVAGGQSQPAEQIAQAACAGHREATGRKRFQASWGRREIRTYNQWIRAVHQTQGATDL